MAKKILMTAGVRGGGTRERRPVSVHWARRGKPSARISNLRTVTAGERHVEEICLRARWEAVVMLDL